MGKVKNDRYLKAFIEEDAIKDHKLVFLSGPRQVGKTTLSKAFLDSDVNYFTWDDSKFRKQWNKDVHAIFENKHEGPIVFDEIHKDRKWKTKIKGFYDLYGEKTPIIVTGSARLEHFRKGGDSLMGRYLPYRLHPFTVAENANPSNFKNLNEAISNLDDRKQPLFKWHDLMTLGGFPEPIFAGNEGKANRWSRLRFERLIEEDVRDFRNISNLNALKMVCQLMPEKVGGLFSINSLQEDVGVAYATLREWVSVFESLYYCFRISPYSKNLKRSLKAETKLYLFDILQIPAENKSARLENLTALHLKKACDYFTDTAQGEFELRYIRDREKREVDFLILKDSKPWIMVECKSNDLFPQESLERFGDFLKVEYRFQLTSRKGYDRYYPEKKIRVIEYEKFFKHWV